MPAPEGRRSPFDTSRFLFREDSDKWQPESGQGKTVRWASTSSIGSERAPSFDDLSSKSRNPVPPYQARTRRFPLSLLFLAFTLAVVAIGAQLTRDASASLSQYSRRLKSCLCTTSDSASSDETLSPALQSLIERYVLQTIALQTRGEKWDFARKSNGGRVALQVTSGYYGLFGSRANDPAVVIDDDIGVRKCWSMPPLPSQLGIRLSHVIRPSYISMEHFSADLLGQTSHAPQNATLWGVVDGKVNAELYQTLAPEFPTPERRAPSITKGLQWAPLASFVYDIHNSNSIQTFPISQQYGDVGMTFGVFALEVYSNWGNATTCLFKVGIHGEDIR